MPSKKAFNLKNFLPPNQRKLFYTVSKKKHIALMHFIADDSYGSPIKENCAFSKDNIFPAKINESETDWERINFDNASNSFPEEFYYRVCNIKTATLTVDISASEWRVIVLRRIDNFSPDIVSIYSGSGAKSFSLPFELQDKPARLSVEVHYTGELNLKKVVWSTEAPKTLPPLGLSITTYNKPAYLLPNIDIIQDSNAAKSDLLEVIIVNNGNPLPPIDPNVTVVTQPNVGGTGGFIYGYKYFKRKSFSKFLIMDDDISIQPDFVDRIYAISCFAGAMHVGSLAEIMNTDRRIIKEQGGSVSPEHPFGLNLHNHMLDIAGWERHRLYGFYPVQFSGWWSLLVHIEDSDPHLPSQMFIKRDDITFGYESYKRGISTYVFPNLNVAHSEEGAPAYYYFDIRNDLIMRARSRGALKIDAMKLIHIARSLCIRMFTDKQRMFNLALSDFLDGPEAFTKLNISQKLAQVRKIASKLEPLPVHPAHVDEHRRLKGYKFFVSFFLPKSYQKVANTPVIHHPTGSNVTGLSAYYEPVPFTGKAYLRKRSFASIFLFLKSIILILRLLSERSRLCKNYAKRV